MASTKSTRRKLYTGKAGLIQLKDGTWVEDFKQYEKDNPGVNLDRVKKNAKQLLIAQAKKKKKKK